MITLLQNYRELDRECALFYDELRAGRNFEKGLFIPTMEKKTQMEERLKTLFTQVEALDVPDPVYSIVKEQMRNFLYSQKLNLKSYFERPSKHISGVVYAFSSIGRKDSRNDDLRQDLLLEKFATVEPMWQAMSSWIDTVSPLYLQELVAASSTLIRTITFEADHLEETFPNLQNKEPLKSCLEALVASCQDWKKQTEALVSKKGIVPQTATADDDTIQFDEAYYRDLLENELGINLDELISWHEQEVEKTRGEVFAIVNQLDIDDEKPTTMEGVNNLLLKYAGPYDSPEKTFEMAQKYLDTARDECRKIVPLPEESCRLTKIPEQIKYSYPWGGYGGGCPIRRPLTGEYYVNDFNYTAVTDGWIKMMAIHESYPGHHVQFVRTTTDRLPEVVKIGSRSVPITEGTAHRSERIFEYIFKEDQFYPLFVAYRRHHTSVRIKVELGLRYYGITIGQAVDLYVQELGFDRATARGQVSAQESMQGYFNSYYYGMKKIEDLEKQFGFDKDTYTRYLFDAGRISLELFERFLALSEQDKARYTNDFASLIQFGQ